MTLPPRGGRLGVFMAGLALLLAALARDASTDAPSGAQVSPQILASALAALAGVLAFSTRSGLFLQAARASHVAVGADARLRHRILLRVAPAVVIAAAGGAGVASSPLAEHPAFAALMAGLLGVAIAFVAHRLDRNAPRRPRPTTRLGLILLDTALPAAVVASLVGVVVGVMRLSGHDVVSAGSAARHLGGTTFLYAVLLGFGGFLKTYSEQRAGLVTVGPVTANVPGPILSGGVIGVVILFAGPGVLPDLPLASVLVLKGVGGFVIGGTVSALGAIQGARAAHLGLTRRRR